MAMKTIYGLFTLSDGDCESDVANNWVRLVSDELFTFGDVKHKILISVVIGCLEIPFRDRKEPLRIQSVYLRKQLLNV